MAQGSRMVFSFQRHQLNEPPFSISMVRRPGEQKLIKLAIPNTQPYWSWLTVTRIFHKHVNEVMYIYIYISVISHTPGNQHISPMGKENSSSQLSLQRTCQFPSRHTQVILLSIPISYQKSMSQCLRKTNLPYSRSCFPHFRTRSSNL